MDNLNQIRDMLPNQAAEEALTASFRASALSLTSLFKAGKTASKRSYNAGKREALQDVLEFVQAGLDEQSNKLNVAKLIDYICARQEALRAEQEDENEADEGPVPPASTRTSRTTSTSSRKHNNNTHPAAAASRQSSSVRQHSNPSALRHSQLQASIASSSSPPPPATPHHSSTQDGSSMPSPLTRAQAKKERTRSRSKHGLSDHVRAQQGSTSEHHRQLETTTTTTLPTATATTSTEESDPVTLGMKRRWSATTNHQSPRIASVPLENEQHDLTSFDRDDATMEVDMTDARPHKRPARR